MQKRTTAQWVICALAAATLTVGLMPAARAADRTWKGAANGDWFAAGNWDPPGSYPQAGEAVSVTNTSILLTNSTADLASFTITNATLTFTNWATALTASNVVVQNGGIIAHANNSATDTNASGAWVPDARVYVVCTNFTVATGGLINADARGYAGSVGWYSGTAQKGGPGGGQYVCGGGYGGQGGDAAGCFGGNPYGFANAPTNPGSGGGDGGRGGGAIRVEASGNVTIHGTISANGAGSGTAVAGGASGGGIYISCQGTFSGGTSGVIQANGGSAGTYQYGPGGGGRIAVDCTNVANAKMRFTASQGVSTLALSSPTNAAGMGTLYFPDTGILSTNLDRFEGRIIIPGLTAWNVDQLSVSNGAISLGDGDVALTVNNDLVIGPGGALMVGALALKTGGVAMVASGAVTNPLAVGGSVILNGGELTIGGVMQTSRTTVTVGGNFTLTNASRMYVYGGVTNGGNPNYGALVSVTGNINVAASAWVYPYSHPTNGGSALFRTAGDLTVLTGGGFDADARGYAQGYGPGAGQGTGLAGGGYGGKGGEYRGDSLGGKTYGSSNAPTAPGSGSGPYFDANWPGTAGGGLVRVEASGNVTILGTITANSGTPSGGSGNFSGSGGGIFISCKGDFSGGSIGVLRANGMNAANGGGGGGRIAVAIGFSDAQLADLIAGNNIPGLTIDTQEPSLGTLSVTNGTGQNNPPNSSGAYPGTKQIMRIGNASDRTLVLVGNPTTYGAPSPKGYGTWAVTLGSEFTNTVISPANEQNGVRWACLGWRVTETVGGALITNGGSMQAVFTITTNATLTWLWTNQYQLAVSAGLHGMVNSNDVNGFYTNGTAVSGILATATNAGYSFSSWFGASVPAGHLTDNPLTVNMEQIRTNLTALFASESGETKTWNGAGNWTSNTNWSPEGMPGSRDYAILQSGTSILSDAVSINSLAVSNGATLLFTNWNTCLYAPDVTIRNGGVIAHGANSATTTNVLGTWVPDARIYIVCTHLTVVTGGVINADARGYKMGCGPGVNGTYSGGGYGGKGGNAQGIGGSPYGSSNAPVDPGSGSSDNHDANWPGSAGGGLIQVVASGNVTVNGTITANGESPPDNGTGGTYGGSGGGIYIICQGNIIGGTSGVIRADGMIVQQGAGGGGRIAVWIGVPDNTRQKYLDGTPGHVIQSGDRPRYYLGSVSVTNGTSKNTVYNPPNPGGAYPGTALFFTFPPGGTIFSFR